MARRTSFVGLMNQIARDNARFQREQERLARAKQKEIERIHKEGERLKAKRDKEAKQQYLQDRMEETDDRNQELEEQLSGFSTILEHALQVNDVISFDSLRIKDKFQPFVLPPELEKEPKSPRIEHFHASIRKPSTIGKLIPGSMARYEKAIQRAESDFQGALVKHEATISDRAIKIKQLEDEHAKAKEAFEEKVRQRNQEVDEFEDAYHKGDPTAVCSYCTMVLERSSYPEGFPQEFRIAYVPESKELVIEYELPDVKIIPSVAEYRYVKSKDAIEEKARKTAETKDLYQDIIASTCIRTLHEIIEADQGQSIGLVVFNGFVQTIDPSTGRDVRPCLISIRTSKERFSEINLSRIDKRACLRNLGAQVSPSPHEMLAIKPIVEFEMVDRRFVEQSDILCDLESRPNLMDLNPFEFENLVTNLFEKSAFRRSRPAPPGMEAWMRSHSIRAPYLVAK